MKKIVLALMVMLPLYAHAGFEIEDGALKSKQDLQRAADEKKAADEAAAKAQAEAKRKAEAAKAAEEAKAKEKAGEVTEEVVDNKPLPAPVWVKAPVVSLRTIVNEWSARAGWDVSWDMKDDQSLEDKDYALEGGLRVVGTYKDAITKLFASLPVDIKVRAQFWSENDPPLLYVIKGEAQ